jgi:O-antigen ligase/Flp pilus assembly protein TadD
MDKSNRKAAPLSAGVLFISVIALRPHISGAVHPFVEGFFSIIVLLALAILVLSDDIRLSDSASVNQTLGLLLCFYVWAIVSLAWSTDRGNGISEVVTLTIGVAAFILSFHFSRGFERNNKYLGAVVILAGTPVILRAFYQKIWGLNAIRGFLADMSAIGQDVGDLTGYIASGRVFAGFLNPNMLAAFCAIMVPVAIALTVKQKVLRAKVIFGAATLALWVVLFLTGSLGGALAAVVGIMVFTLLAGKIGGRAIILLCVFALAVVFAVFAIRGTDFLLGPDGSLTQRAGYMAAGIRMFFEKPLPGWGSGSVPGALMGFIARGIRPVTDPHNFIIRSMINWGILGMLIMSSFFFSLFHSIRKGLKNSENRLLGAAFTGASAAFIFHSLMDMSFSVPETAFFGWVVMGGALGCISGSREETTRITNRDTKKIAVGAVLLALCVPVLLYFQAEFYFYQGNQAYMSGDYEESSRLFNESSKLLPLSGKYHIREGRSLMNLEKLSDAREKFMRAAKLTPYSPYPPWELGRLDAKLGNHEKALSFLDSAIEKYPTSPRIRLERAQALMKLGRGEETVMELVEAEAYASFDPEAARIIRQALDEIGQNAVDNVFNSQEYME